jgi:hypothetical protein
LILPLGASRQAAWFYIPHWWNLLASSSAFASTVSCISSNRCPAWSIHYCCRRSMFVWVSWVLICVLMLSWTPCVVNLLLGTCDEGMLARSFHMINTRLKDRLGDQRGGSEWEPIKILLLRENSIYTPNSQPRIPTRVCQGHVVTTDVPTLGTNPKQSQSGSTKQEAKDLAILQQPRRTVRGHLADCPRLPRGRPATHGGLSVKHKQNDPTGTSTRGRSVPCPRTVREQLVPRGQSAHPGGRSAKHLPTKNRWPTGSKRRRSEHVKNTKNTWAKRLHADTRHPPRGQSARCEPTREQQPESQLESTLPPILPWISQTVEALEERFGEDVKHP